MSQERSAAWTESAYTSSRRDHWDALARQMDTWSGYGGYYHARLEEVYRYLIPPGQRVLEIGCGRGDLLAALEPSLGVGVDLSREMILRARSRHPRLTFLHGDAHALPIGTTFDAIVLSDLVNDVWDVQRIFMEAARVSHASTRLFLNAYSRMWEGPLEATRRLGLSKPTLFENWLTVADLSNLLWLSGLEVIRSWSEILFPLRLPGITAFLNKVLVRFWPFTQLAMTNVVVARMFAPRRMANPSVSVIVPARNEAGNIPSIFERLPRLGETTELIFVEGHSTDNTRQVIQDQMQRHPRMPCRLLQQSGVGKGDAVRLGFSRATGDVLMILDADLTVPPEALGRFYDALVGGRGEFINGVRLIYPMADEAMRFVNLIGNRFFSVAFSWLLGQTVKDTLCGTKVLWRQDYERIRANRGASGTLDPFGDFDLLFGAASLHLRIVDMPVRYGQRTYGSTNIERWRHGWLLLRMLPAGFRRLKAV